MKSPTRIFRRRKSQSRDGSFFKKESSQEQSFFAEPVNVPFFQPQPHVIQRKCENCEQEEKVQRVPADQEEEKKKPRLLENQKEDEKRLHRSPEEKKEDDKKLHMKSDGKKEDEKKLQRKEGSPGDSPGTTPYVNRLSGRGNALPGSTQKFFSERMGYDFSGVKIHTGTDAEKSAKAFHAKAYAVDNHIVFNQGRYDTASYEGKKLLAHELTHVMQQDTNGSIARKEAAAEEDEPCTAGSVDLEALTSSVYHKGAGAVAGEKTTKSKGCPDCADDCVNITGILKVPYNVTTKINLPVVPASLTPCQQERVSAAINGPLLAHEKQHVKAFETFNGTASLPVNYHGCEGDYTTYTGGLADTEFERRKSSADAKSAALDPFSVPVDLCCKDKTPKK